MVSISTLIQELEKIREKHGNIPVVFKKVDNTWLSEVAYKIQDTDDDEHEVYKIEVETKTLFFY